MITKSFQEINLPMLGMGAMRLETSFVNHIKEQKIINYAMANGINYFDTSYVYGKEGSSEKALGEMLAEYPRQSYYLATKYAFYTGSDYKSMFEEQLARLKTNYIDFYMLHGVNDNTYQHYIDNNCMEYFSELKQKGIIKYFGFSSHASVKTLTNLVDYRSWDFAMIQLNYYDWIYGSARKEYEVLEKRNIPIIVMEPLRGGRLTTLSPKATAILKSIHPDWSTASWFLRWIKKLSGVQIVLSGMKTIEHMKENNILFSDAETLNDEEEKFLLKACETLREELSVLCTHCLYCLNVCPVNINIPKIIDLYNSYKTDKPWNIDETIKNIDSQGKSIDCTGCGICTSRCPQKINIASIMSKINRLELLLGYFKK